METYAVEAQSDHSREQVIFALERLARIASDRGDHPAAERARALVGRLRADLFNLAVVGQFKRGKTTLINALLGRALLPAAVVPLTSVVTILEYAPDESITIHFLDGSAQEIRADELAEYVTERGNPENRRGVAVATVGLPAPLLREGLRLIDTPGVGSVHLHNTEVAYSFIRHVDGAVFLVTADPPVSEAELQFLQDLHQEVQQIFFVQNKADQVPAAEREESREFSRGQLSDAIGEEIGEMFSVSAKRALEAKLASNARRLEESGLPRLEAVLVEFARVEKGRVALATAQRTVTRLAHQQLAAIGIEKAALAMPLEELERKRAQFETYLTQLRQARDDNRHLLRAAGERLITDVINRDILELQARVRPSLMHGLRQEAESAGGSSGRELLRRLNAYTRTRIEAVYAEWVVQEERHIAEALRESIARFVRQINQALADLARVSQELFHARVGELSVTVDLAGQSEFYFAPWQMQVSPDTLTGSLLYLLPGRWVRARIVGAVQAKLVEQLDMHGGRVRYDFARRLQGSLRDFERRIVEAMDITIGSIEEAIGRAAAQKRKAGEDVSSRERELAAQEVALAAAVAGQGAQD